MFYNSFIRWVRSWTKMSNRDFSIIWFKPQFHFQAQSVRSLVLLAQSQQSNSIHGNCYTRIKLNYCSPHRFKQILWRRKKLIFALKSFLSVFKTIDITTYKMRFLRQNKSSITCIVLVVYFLCFVNSYFFEDENEKLQEDRADARSIGKLPNLNIKAFLSATMEPNNAMVQVGRAWGIPSLKARIKSLVGPSHFPSICWAKKLNLHCLDVVIYWPYFSTFIGPFSS